MYDTRYVGMSTEQRLMENGWTRRDEHQTGTGTEQERRALDTGGWASVGWLRYTMGWIMDKVACTREIGQGGMDIGQAEN